MLTNAVTLPLAVRLARLVSRLVRVGLAGRIRWVDRFARFGRVARSGAATTAVLAGVVVEIGGLSVALLIPKGCHWYWKRYEHQYSSNLAV